MSTPEQETHHEVEVPEPRIYVADLAAYNNGILHGRWIDADQDEDDIWIDIGSMLERSPVAGSEEIAIHDYEGFGRLRLSEYESVRNLASIGRAIAEHGDAITAWIDYLGASEIDDAVQTFEEAYLGEWPSMKAFAEHLIEDMGVEITVRPESWAHYVVFDTEALARDLDTDLHSSDTADGQLHIFTPSAAP